MRRKRMKLLTVKSKVKINKNSAISSFPLHNIAPLITLATQYKFYDAMGGQTITQLER